MANWAAWLAYEEDFMAIGALAAVAQQRLAAIWPFSDGNGQVARLVMNLILMRHGYPPAVILPAQHRRYHRAMAQADDGRIGPLADLVGQAVERSLTFNIAAAQSPAIPVAAEEGEPALPVGATKMETKADMAAEISPALPIVASQPEPEAASEIEDWVPLRIAAEWVPLDKKQLAKLARAGTLVAEKRDNIWHTNQQAVADYLNAAANGQN